MTVNMIYKQFFTLASSELIRHFLVGYRQLQWFEQNANLLSAVFHHKFLQSRMKAYFVQEKNNSQGYNNSM